MRTAPWPNTGRLRLEEDEVHLYLSPFGPVEESALAPQEVARSERFRFEADRRRFKAGRTLLRQLLAAYLGTDPASIPIEIDRFGKPFIDENPIHFNISHSDEIFLLGFSRSPVGVDVERIRPVEQELAGYFTAAERSALAASNDREALFFDYWTRKEAVLKALGTGFFRELDSFEVGESARTLQPLTVDIDGKQERVWIQAFRPQAELQCAVCSRSTNPPRFTLFSKIGD
jgi:4'-phosphopantetheinyl transferase